MSGTNDFEVLAGAAGANVLTQAQYLALTTLLADGFQSGILASNQLNKVLRQSTIMAAMIGQLIADATGQNAADDGTVTTLEANLARAMRGDVWQGGDTGAANAYALTLHPAPLALAPGMMVAIDNIVASNTGASTLNVNGLGALPIQFPGGGALQGGELVASYGAILRLNHTGTAWILLHSTGLDRQLGGAGQSWQDVHASRALGTTYTNNTGRPIQAIVSATSTAASALMTATIGGVSIQGPAQGTSGINASMSFVVPNNVTYSVSMQATATLSAWAELR